MKHERAVSDLRARPTRRRASKAQKAPRVPIQIRMSTEELHELDDKAEWAGLDRSKFIRKAVRQSMIIDSANMRRQAWLLSNISNNLNQLAKYANTHQRDADALAIVQQVRLLRTELAWRFPLPDLEDDWGDR